MKFSFNRKAFIDALLVGGSMAGKSKVLPILDCIKINVRQGNSTISSYNGEVSITKKVEIDSDEELSLCVNKQDLDNFLRAIPDETVCVEYDSSVILIKHKKGKLSLPTFDANEFPKPNIKKDGDCIKVDSASLLSIISEANKFRSTKDGLRPIMSCINMSTNGELLEVSATDSMSLYSSSIELTEEHNGFVLNITDASIQPLKNMLDRCAEVTIINGETSFTVKSDDSLLSAVKMEGKYPNVKCVIPKYETCSRICVNVKEFEDAIKRCALNADKSSAIVTINSNTPSFLEVSANDIDYNKSALEYVDCELDGSFNAFSIKYANILNVLSCIKSDSVTIAVKSSTSPIIIEDKLANNNIFILMPFLNTQN